MNNIQRVIEESNKEFDEKFPPCMRYYTEALGFTDFMELKREEIKSHISETIRQVLEAVEEEVEGKKIIEKSVVKISYGTGEESEVEVDSDRAVFYNTALSDIQSLLGSAKDNINGLNS